MTDCKKEAPHCPEVHLRAVSLDFLLQFTWENNLWEIPTREVVERIIVPQTDDEKLPYVCCHVPPEDVGLVGVFVSHAWTNPFGLLVGAARKFVSERKAHGIIDGYLWVDIFAITQHTVPSQCQELAQIENTVLFGDTTLVVLDSACGLPLRRVWCIFEIYCSLMTGIYGKLKVRAGSIDSEGLFTPCADGDQLRAVAETVDISSAESVVDADKAMILRRISEMSRSNRDGHDEINRKIKRAVRQGWI